jgi:hypothetical protein
MPHSYDANMSAMVQTSAPPPPQSPPMRPGLTTSEVRVRADFALAQD